MADHWINGYLRRGEGRVANTYIADYSVHDLMDKGYIDRETGDDFLNQAGIEDFFWQVTWPEDFETPDELLEMNIKNAQGIVVFVHGWTGNHAIWEDLPGLTVHQNRTLVAISVDHNGFGKSSFVEHSPDLDMCNPPAAMSTLQHFVDMLKIRRQLGDPGQRVINFVGHSMGGATLFYLNPIVWRFGEVTRYAIAPALLLEDEMYRAFFTTLGIGISLLERVRGLNFIGQALKPSVVQSLCQGASDHVKSLHSQQYDDTARGITGATFLAMGRLKNREIARDWNTFRVMLGHKDRLVGLTGMMDLLGKLEFPVANMRVVPGSHYMFSVGSESPENAYLHSQNRDLVVQEIIDLHDKAYKIQKSGLKFG